jgi:hypothetical protein
MVSQPFGLTSASRLKNKNTTSESKALMTYSKISPAMPKGA